MNGTLVGKGSAHPDGFWLLFAVRLLLIGLLLRLIWAPAQVGWHLFGLAPPNDPVPVQAAAPAIRTPAVVLSTRARGIGSTFDGTVASLQVRRGQRVTRGQLLFQMDVEPLKQRLTELNETVRSADAELLSERSARDAALAGLEEMLAEARGGVTAAARRAAAFRLARRSTGGETSRELQDRIRVLSTLWEERRSAWDGRITAADTRKRQAAAEAARLRQWLRESKRHSPLDGVVTSVRASAGTWVRGATPVVRVDDPQGYRIVTLVRNRTRAVPEVGMELPVISEAGRILTRVSRVVPGWDREVLSTWVWLVPLEPAELVPRQRLQAELPPPNQA